VAIAAFVVVCVALALLIWCCRRARTKKVQHRADAAGSEVSGSEYLSADSAALSINDLVRSLVAMQTFGNDLERRGYDEASSASDGKQSKLSDIVMGASISSE
jgi:hypothetical protein